MSFQNTNLCFFTVISPYSFFNSVFNYSSLLYFYSVLCIGIQQEIKQVDILISKNHMLQILYLKHCV